jgi:hypothetical protein
MATMDPQPVIGIIGMGDVSSVQNFYLRLAGDGRNVADPVARWARCTLGD